MAAPHISGETGGAKPLAIDLFCGLGGWTDGLLALGYRVVGYDIEEHVYGDQRYKGELVVQDVLTLHGSEFKDAALIVASPPCQRYSYMAMPWSRAKAQAAAIRADESGQMLADLNQLFDACFRIQKEASIAAGRHIPMVVENVRGAIPWVGRSRWNFGSFHLWGDVPALMPPAVVRKNEEVGGGSWFAIGSPGQKVTGANPDGRKVPGFRFDGSGRSFQSASVKQRSVERPLADGSVKQRWFNDGPRTPDSLASSSSPRRKAASAMIAKIPTPLALHIGRTYWPETGGEHQPAAGLNSSSSSGGCLPGVRPFHAAGVSHE